MSELKACANCYRCDKREASCTWSVSVCKECADRLTDLVGDGDTRAEPKPTRAELLAAADGPDFRGFADALVDSIEKWKMLHPETLAQLGLHYGLIDHDYRRTLADDAGDAPAKRERSEG